MRVNGIQRPGARPCIETNTGVDWNMIRQSKLDNRDKADKAETARLDRLEYRNNIIIVNRRSTRAFGGKITC